MASNADYIPLRRHLSLDDQEYDGFDEGSDADTEGTPSKRPRLIRTRTQRLPSAISLTALFSFAAFIISLLSSILVVYQLLFTSRALVPSVQRVYDIDANTLRRPSLYMGLERVPLTNAPSDTDQGGSGAGHHDDGSHNSSKPQESAALPVGPGRATAISHVNLLNPFVPYPRDGWVLVTTYVRLQSFVKVAWTFPLRRMSRVRSGYRCYAVCPYTGRTLFLCFSALAPAPPRTHSIGTTTHPGKSSCIRWHPDARLLYARRDRYRPRSSKYFLGVATTAPCIRRSHRGQVRGKHNDTSI